VDNHSDTRGSAVNHPGGLLAGLLIGGLAGAGVMLLLTPQSGKKTRVKIQQKNAARPFTQADRATAEEGLMVWADDGGAAA